MQGLEGLQPMTAVTHTELTTATDTLLAVRAVWTAPVLERFDTVSAESGPGGPLGDNYDVS
jgi:hypothetical protein